MNRRRVSELLGELRDALAGLAREELGRAEPSPEGLADRFTDWLQDAFGGQMVYFPKEDLPKRDAAIYAAFNGGNYAELARRFGLSEVRIYTIIRRERRRRQPRLPGF